MTERDEFISYHEALMALSHSDHFLAQGRRRKLESLCELCGHLLSADRISVWQMSDSDTAHCETLFEAIAGRHGTESDPLRRIDHPAYFEAIEHHRLIDAPDAANDQRTASLYPDYMKPRGIRAMLDAPVFSGERVSGLICLETAATRNWSIPEMSFVSAVADTISLINSYDAWRDSQQALDYLTYFDSLTGLMNRQGIEERLGQILSRHSSVKLNPGAVFWLDIDRLKNVNDGLGKHVGDRVLRQLGERLRECYIPGKDQVGRLGGDEFIILTRHQPSVSEALTHARQLLDELAAPVAVDGTSLSVSGCIGVALFPDHGEEVVELLQCAESAMYQAKSLGFHRAQMYHPEQSATVRSRFALEVDLRQAIRDETLSVHYQPIINAQDQSVDCLEALARWHHPQQGEISPVEFLTLADDAGLGSELGLVVLRRVFKDIAVARERGDVWPRVAVNLASAQLGDPDFPAKVEQLMAQYDVPGDRLCMEVVEDQLKSESAGLMDTLNHLHALGIHLAIDDFGTGYSSLARLKRFPFQQLKIDRSFIRGLPHDTNDHAIVLSILGLAGGLGLEVVAEGVESVAQRDWLCDHGCALLQGYLLARPQPLNDIRRLLEEHRSGNLTLSSCKTHPAAQATGGK